MPLYEYKSLEDGETIELLRPMADADKPVVDPKGKGRKFVRTLSTFQMSGLPRGSESSPRGHVHGGGCGCGNPHGPCNS